MAKRLEYHAFHVHDENGDDYDYEATDMRMALTVHHHLRGTEAVEVKREAMTR